ncbi:mannitol dehydrogenase family protein [Rhodobacteraceae bacterium F11138]|nr:mannitol dehydrogenase family protein [Rhodobacteraceae bacterium F11138]
MRLSTDTLKNLPDGVAGPSYDRRALTPGILHIGLGNFHRAHQAVYLDALFDLGLDHDWAIIGAGIMPFDRERREMLDRQDYLTTVVEMSEDRRDARVTGAMIGFCPVDTQSIIRQIADPAIRIVSLTITEGGYFIDATTGAFDPQDPDIIHDAQNPTEPRTVFGLLLAGLALRRQNGHPPPTILSCDNIPDNGRITRQALCGLAAMYSPELCDWISRNVAFPGSMVDRITPATTDSTRALVKQRFGIIDAAPVACEPFRQWVMEDNFPLGRPALEKVGVQFVQDITPFETMKLRILNAGHAAIAYPSALMGHAFVHDAMADPDISDWLDQLMRREVIPTLQPVPGLDYRDYLDTCTRRFSNPAVRDTIARLCQDGSNRQPKFVLPTLTAALDQSRDIEGLALEVAFWCRYCAETADLDDPRAAMLARAARDCSDPPAGFLALGDVFGPLQHNAVFATAFARHIKALREQDARTVLRRYLNRKEA